MSVTTPTAPAAFEETAHGPLGSMRGSRGRHRRTPTWAHRLRAAKPRWLVPRGRHDGG